ncbi:hypothetical protein BH20ACI3_BH20ACI3_15970 [soil metagenome]
MTETNGIVWEISDLKPSHELERSARPIKQTLIRPAPWLPYFSFQTISRIRGGDTARHAVPSSPQAALQLGSGMQEAKGMPCPGYNMRYNATEMGSGLAWR